MTAINKSTTITGVSIGVVLSMALACYSFGMWRATTDHLVNAVTEDQKEAKAWRKELQAIVAELKDLSRDNKRRLDHHMDEHK